ncbi:MAG: arginase family protein [Candidatus Helarchaeota archaeon]
MIKKYKVFGASLDPSDSFKKISIKQKYLNDLAIKKKSKHMVYQDAYDAFIKESEILNDPIFEKIGKFPVESWLRPKPDIEDYIFMNPIEFRTFLDADGCKEYSEQMKQYIEEYVLPDIPIMIGADHSLTGGVLKALSKKYSPKDIAIIILDGHFDAIPTELRLDLALYSKEHKDEVQVVFPEVLDSISENMEIPFTYNCGTFIYHLLKEKIIIPENLIIFGCVDYPIDVNLAKKDSRVKNYIDFYLSFEESGVKFIPNTQDCETMNKKLQNILNTIDASYLYISIDVDIGSLNSILAARFMDFIGLDGECLINTSKIIKDFIKLNKFELIGLDIMEIEIFFLNAKLKSGKIDNTMNIMDHFLSIVL